jgi:outer membrane protein assembly factor BamB
LRTTRSAVVVYAVALASLACGTDGTLVPTGALDASVDGGPEAGAGFVAPDGGADVPASEAGVDASVSDARSDATAKDAGPDAPGPDASAPILDVLTWHNDLARTGQYLGETVLTPANVRPATFGKLFVRPVDGQIYGQPLYKSNVFLAGGTHDVVVVATQNDSVYAIDAGNGTVLWKDTFTDSDAGVTTIPAADVDSKNITPQIGITSTPVIDPVTDIVYVVVRTKENGAYAQRLHALDLKTGDERDGGPVLIAPIAPGVGTGADDAGLIRFDPLIHNQRSALVLLGGVVYVAWASHGDQGGYHGWIVGFDASTLAQVSMLNLSPNNPPGTEGQAGIWMSGAAMASDGENLFVSTANGYFDATESNPGTEYGDCLLKISPGTLTVADFFAPYDQTTLEAMDLDLGSGGVVLLPDQPGLHTHVMVGGGKQGYLYIADRDDLGGFNQTDQVVQILQSGPLFSTPAYFDGRIYYKAAVKPSSSLVSTAVVQGTLDTSTTTRSTVRWGWPGSTPSISANGAANGIVWVIDGSGTDAILRAFDAADVTNELYDSTQNAHDALSGSVKFAVPTIARGHVYVGTANELAVFGLL